MSGTNPMLAPAQPGPPPGANPMAPPAPQMPPAAPQMQAGAPPAPQAPAGPPGRAWADASAAKLRSMKLTPEQVQQKIAAVSDILPKLGELLRKPNLTEKDVVKEAAAAAAQSKTPIAEVVSSLLTMPKDPAELRGWVQQQYANNIMAAVQLKSLAQQMGIPDMPGPEKAEAPDAKTPVAKKPAPPAPIAEAAEPSEPDVETVA